MLTPTASFSEAYRAGRFLQLELFSQSDLRREAEKYGLAVDDATLQELDRAGVFVPIAFAGEGPHGFPYGPRWAVEALTFRDEVGFRRWRQYRLREDGWERVIALYSPWQLMYLKSALEERIVPVPLPLLLGRRDRLLSAIRKQRPFRRVERDFWLRLETHWRPAILLLCWLQNRYLPYVTGRSTMAWDAEAGGRVDAVREELRTFDPGQMVGKLGLGTEDVRVVYEQLARIARWHDPIRDWYLVVRAASPRARERFRGDARLAQLVYDAAEVLRRFLRDLTGEIPPDCDEIDGFGPWKERLLGDSGPRLVYSRDDFKRILEAKRLSPHAIHVFVEGPSDERLIARLIDSIWGDPRALGIQITPLHGIDKLARHRALVEAFATYARKALLVADDEGKIARDVERLRREGLLVEDDSYWPWKRNIEEDSATPEELVDIANRLAAAKGKNLDLSTATLEKIQAASGKKKGLASRIVEYAEQRRVAISKEEIADELATLILAELEAAEDETPVVERRPVLGLALALGRFTISI